MQAESARCAAHRSTKRITVSMGLRVNGQDFGFHANPTLQALGAEGAMSDTTGLSFGGIMKALTLWQPWASLVAMGEKTVETRCWKTQYRGPLAIHAAAQIPPKWLGASRHTEQFRNELADVFQIRRDAVDSHVRTLPRGAVLCVVNLCGIEETLLAGGVLSQRELIFGNYEEGRYAWALELIETFATPIPAKGNRMIWNWDSGDIAPPLAPHETRFEHEVSHKPQGIWGC